MSTNPRHCRLPRRTFRGALNTLNARWLQRRLKAMAEEVEEALSRVGDGVHNIHQRARVSYIRYGGGGLPGRNIKLRAFDGNFLNSQL